MRYHLVLPPPWERIDLEGDYAGQVRQIVARAVDRAAGTGIPPDALATARARAERDLTSRLREAKDSGAAHYYLPTDLMHGVHVPASFTVSRVVPNALADQEVAARVLAARLAEPGVTAVSTADAVWARTDRTRTRPADSEVDAELQARQVEYLAPAPDDPRSWLIVTLTTFGDGVMDSDFTTLTVELFDAIMSTWRWDAVATGSPAES